MVLSDTQAVSLIVAALHDTTKNLPFNNNHSSSSFSLCLCVCLTYVGIELDRDDSLWDPLQCRRILDKNEIILYEFLVSEPELSHVISYAN